MSTPNFEALISTYIDQIRGDDPGMANHLASLEAAGQKELGFVLTRFDLRSQDTLNPRERIQATRVLKRVQKFSEHSLNALNRVLDYLDLNANSKLEPYETELVCEMIEAFCRVDSDNETLSTIELELMYAVLRNLDDDNTHRLEADERLKLRSSLKDPKAFWIREKETNPLVQEILAKQAADEEG